MSLDDSQADLRKQLWWESGNVKVATGPELGESKPYIRQIMGHCGRGNVHGVCQHDLVSDSSAVAHNP